MIGPADDGGYYLLALREPRPELFAGIAWSTPTVREQTRARAAAAGLSVRELGTCATSTRSTTCGPSGRPCGPCLGDRPELRDAIEWPPSRV